MPLGNVPWKSFPLCCSGVKPEQNVPLWMDVNYDIWYRDLLQIVRNMLANPSFNGGIEYSPYYDYNVEDQQYWKNFMSGNWAWNQADIITQNQETHSSTFVPLIIGSDKTVVSVATGQTEYHPLYLSISNVHNSFLAILKSTKEHNGPYIADYLEQLLLSGVMQNWCPQCLANSKDLDGGQLCLHRCEAHTELLIEQLLYKQDHLVNWVEDYLNVTHSTRHAAKIMDDIDHRIAAVAPFTGLRHFPHGCGFQKWTGDDSKALMKVYLAAIEGHVPQDVVRTFIKEPWCRSSRFKALGQMLLTNQRLDKLAAAHADFEACGMLCGTCLMIMKMATQNQMMM
ncbi:hypothetical protein DFH29DRAFT_984927 [Suillus ampliporus]|nr:hypothetical protein DFH29DRAFT_984927 [Suillus ampliporus]